MSAGNTLIDIKRLSKLLGISVNSVKVRISKGTVPSPDERIDGQLYWKRETVSDMVSAK